MAMIAMEDKYSYANDQMVPFPTTLSDS